MLAAWRVGARLADRPRSFGRVIPFTADLVLPLHKRVSRKPGTPAEPGTAAHSSVGRRSNPAAGLRTRRTLIGAGAPRHSGLLPKPLADAEHDGAAEPIEGGRRLILFGRVG